MLDEKKFHVPHSSPSEAHLAWQSAPFESSTSDPTSGHDVPIAFLSARRRLPGSSMTLGEKLHRPMSLHPVGEMASHLCGHLAMQPIGSCASRGGAHG